MSGATRLSSVVGTTPTDAWQTVRAAVDSFAPYLHDSGELHDPVFGVPTQYGTAYYAYVNAATATSLPAGSRQTYLDRAIRGVHAALRHTADPGLPATASTFLGDTASVEGSESTRDFTWPPIMKTFRLLRSAGVAAQTLDTLAQRIATVDIHRSFGSRPPSNWSSVWLSGEWIRVREGLSPLRPEQIDACLSTFFDQAIDLEQGLFQEHGLPNSYDLFTRFHLADMLAEGYQGRERDRMQRLMLTGVSRSLALQLSDGSLASAYRSTGQTWTLGAQVAYFTHAARFFARRDEKLATEAAAAAQRAMASFALWQRPDGPFSPVQNLLPATRRVGYEGYTADAHYSALALAFVASALLTGYDETPAEWHRTSVHVEREPTHRALVHRGPVSVQINADPAAPFDAFGITDLTFGTGRLLQFGPTARHRHSDALVNLGIALRERSGPAPLDIVAQRRHVLEAEIGRADGGLRLASRVTGIPEYRYSLAVDASDNGVSVEEATPGTVGYKTLLVPYLHNPGTNVHTSMSRTGSGILLRHGDEEITITVDALIERAIDIPDEFESRRGLCSLLRLDLATACERVRYYVRRAA